MAFAHLIVELHCLYGIGDQYPVDPVLAFCKYGVRKLGYHCLSENCEFSGHAAASLEIAYSDKDGEVAPDAWIGFGGDMDPNPYHDKLVLELKESWENICKKKVEQQKGCHMANVIKLRCKFNRMQKSRLSKR